MDLKRSPARDHRLGTGAAPAAPPAAGTGLGRRRPGLLTMAACALVVAAATAVGLGAGAPASAAPVAPFGSGYVWADQPSAESYTPHGDYQYNSTQPWSAVNTVTRQGVGSYTVLLPNLGSASGTVLVTAYGGSANACKVVGWGPSGSTQTILVRCFDPAGQLADTRFTASYTNTVGAAVIGFVWADQPTSASYVPANSYQGNSTGATNRVTRWGVGGYQVWMPNLGGSGGHVQVTAYGTGSERCKVGGWGPSGTDQVVSVRCFTAAGAPVDTRFTATFVRDATIFGAGWTCCQPDGIPTAYVWANEPTSASYVPSTAYQYSNSRARDAISITRLGTGAYAIQHRFMRFTAGNVQVTAYGGGSEHCNVAFWNAAGIQVRCFDAGGSPADALFTASYGDRFVIG